MIDVHVNNVFTVTRLDGTPLPAQVLHEIGNRLMEELLSLEKCNQHMSDSSTSTDAERNELEIDMVITANTRGEAVDQALILCRTAAHADGVHTPNWPSAGNAEPEWPMVSNVEPEPLSFDLATSQASA